MRIKTLIISSIIAVLGLVGTVGLATQPTYAACTDAKTCVKEGVTGAGGTTSNNNLGPLIKNIVNILLYALGAVAVVMIVIGGIKYTTSNGDSSAISSAKNTILYAVIGLVVALLSYAIVNFVITNL